MHGGEEEVVLLVVLVGRGLEVWGERGEHKEGVGYNILIERPLSTYYYNLIVSKTVCPPRRGSITGLGS